MQVTYTYAVVSEAGVADETEKTPRILRLPDKLQHGARVLVRDQWQVGRPCSCASLLVCSSMPGQA